MKVLLQTLLWRGRHVMYENDITDLVLKVQYQNATRLNIRIYPKYLVSANKTQYILSEFLSPSGKFQPI